MILAKNTKKVLKELLKRNKLEISIEHKEISHLGMTENEFIHAMKDLDNNSFFSEYREFIEASFFIILNNKALTFFQAKRKKNFLEVLSFITKR